MTCKNLDRPDLRNARLAFKELNDAAEIPLFRHIYLRRNMDSFCRLRMIASTPHLAKCVKGIVYSEQMVQGPDEPVDFHTWLSDYFGRGFGLLWQHGPDQLKKSYTTVELEIYYSKWCGHLHSQRLMQRFDIEGKDLEDAFSKLPLLDDICFGSVMAYRDCLGPKTREDFGSLGREMLVEPDRFSGIKYHTGQFTAMMAAAYKTKRSLKVIKAHHLPWGAFQQHPEVLAMMTATMSHCEHLTLLATNGPEKTNGDAQVGSMIRNAPRLRKVELTFPLEHQLLGQAADLSRLFVQQSC